MTLQGPCDACSLIDGDTSEKAITKCKVCDADLCAKCKGDIPRRGLAAAIKAGKAVKEAAAKVTHKVTVVKLAAEFHATFGKAK